MPLHLRYAFTPTPNPIRASVGGANPNLVALQVMVSNPGANPVAMEEISITIPVGREGAGALSDSPSLPAPVYDPSGGWVASSAGSTVTLVPGPGGLTNSFLFTLPGIAINGTPGVVPLTVEELAPPAPKVTDSTTYSLVKLEADFPVTNFYASPSTLNDLHEPVTLYWECSAQGQQFAYSVHSDSWQPKDCLNTGNCYTCADGQRGVRTPPLNEMTTFALDVIQTNSDGSRTIHATLYTTVQVLTPSVSPNSYLTQFPSGRMAVMHWLAFNAGRCTVLLDGNTIDDNAPTNTYEQGYSVFLNSDMGTVHQLAVIAHAQSGNAQAPLTFPNFSLNNHSSSFMITNGLTPMDVAATADGSFLLVVSAYTNMLTVVDAVSLAQLSNIHLHGSFSQQTALAVAATPDSALALVTNSPNNLVTVVDLVKRQAEPDPIAVGNSPSDIAVTPDGTLAFVTNRSGNNVSVIDIAKRQTEAGTIDLSGSPQSIAITPDGTLALVVVSLSSSAYVTVIDIASRQVEKNISISRWASTIAITPDGKLAFVVCPNQWSVAVVNIPQRTTATYINTKQGSNYHGPNSIAVMPDGRYALVTNTQANPGADFICVIAVASLSVEPNTITFGTGPGAIAITPGGTLAIVTDQPLNSVTVI